MARMTDVEFDKYISSGMPAPVWAKTGSWNQFKSHAKQIKRIADYLQRRQSGNRLSKNHNWATLFRGHRNSSWKVQSTFDRTNRELTLPAYHEIVLCARREYKKLLESATLDVKAIDNYPYDSTSITAIATLFAESNEISTLPEELRFWVFLRHYGFPSPLLDWTKDYQVAAFFAFQHQSDEEFVTIHTMLPTLCGSTDANLITINDSCMERNAGKDLKPLIRRHTEQKSVYTLFYRDTTDGRGSSPQIFKKHDDMFKENTDNSWGYYFKFNIPASERDRVLKELDAAGITAAKILANTDARLETIQNRLFLY